VSMLDAKEGMTLRFLLCTRAKKELRKREEGCDEPAGWGDASAP